MSEYKIVKTFDEVLEALHKNHLCAKNIATCAMDLKDQFCETSKFRIFIDWISGFGRVVQCERFCEALTRNAEDIQTLTDLELGIFIKQTESAYRIKHILVPMAIVEAIRASRFNSVGEEFIKAMDDLIKEYEENKIGKN